MDIRLSKEISPQTIGLRGYQHNINKRDINRTFSYSYGQLQTSAYASGWG